MDKVGESVTVLRLSISAFIQNGKDGMAALKFLLAAIAIFFVTGASAVKHCCAKQRISSSAHVQRGEQVQESYLLHDDWKKIDIALPNQLPSFTTRSPPPNAEFQ
jgi:hypothetical protein